MKSGGNSRRGSGFFYIHNKAFDARSRGDACNEAQCLSAPGVDSAQVRSFARERFGVFSFFLILLSGSLSGCQQIGKTTSHNQPSIQFTGVPVAGADDPGR